MQFHSGLPVAANEQEVKQVLEVMTLLPLMVLAFWIGLYPKPILAVLDEPVDKLISQVEGSYVDPGSAVVSAPPPAGTGGTALARAGDETRALPAVRRPEASDVVDDQADEE